jgi:hypothetical protein
MKRLDLVRTAVVRPILLVAAVALAGCATSPTTAGKPLVPTAVRWPTSTAAGMLLLQNATPVTLEARADGWVVLTPVPGRPDVGLTAPEERLLVRAVDVRAWASDVRPLLDTAGINANGASDAGFSLGGGPMRLDVRAMHDSPSGSPGLVLVALRACNGVQHNLFLSRPELARFVESFERAATLAGAGAARQPTLDRPYYATEVSCPARALRGNAPLPHPEGVPAASRAVAEIGARFVVDTAGAIEPGSLDFMPGSDSAFVRAARGAVASWRYRPADWDGAPVRQVVHAVLRFDPGPAPPADTGYHQISVRAEPDGWVRFRHVYAVPGDNVVIQEWFTPDSVDAWARRVDSITAAAAALDRSTPRVLEKYATLGSPAGVRYSAGFFAHGAAVDLRAGLQACAGAYSEGESPVDSLRLATFRAAAREAREMRPTPTNASRAPHTAADVACPAWLPWIRARHATLWRVWQYPTMAYPRAMARRNARAEVLASFVVDTAGAADPSTLVVMPRSDPRAVAALAGSLRRMRFRPATRGGVKVSARVIQSMLFEPPSVCPDRNDGPACTRRYSSEPGAK